MVKKKNTRIGKRTWILCVLNVSVRMKYLMYAILTSIVKLSAVFLGDFAYVLKGILRGIKTFVVNYLSWYSTGSKYNLFESTQPPALSEESV